MNVPPHVDRKLLPLPLTLPTAARARERITWHISDKSSISFMSHYKMEEQNSIRQGCVYFCNRYIVYMHIVYKPRIQSVQHLIVIPLFMFCHSGNEQCHVGDVGHHLIHNIVKVTTVAIVQRGVKGHLIAVEYQLDLKQRCNALGCICVVQEVLQGAAYCVGETCQDHTVHIVCVGLPLAAVQV